MGAAASTAVLGTSDGGAERLSMMEARNWEAVEQDDGAVRGRWIGLMRCSVITGGRRRDCRCTSLKKKVNKMRID